MFSRPQDWVPQHSDGKKMRKTGKEGWERMGSWIQGSRMNDILETTMELQKLKWQNSECLEWTHDLDNIITVVLLKVMKIK